MWWLPRAVGFVSFSLAAAGCSEAASPRDQGVSTSSAPAEIETRVLLPTPSAAATTVIASATAPTAPDPTATLVATAAVRIDPSLDSLLIAAAGRGDADDVERLLRLGASVRATDGRGRTALIAAAYGAHLEPARLLIAAGADVNAQDDTRQSAYLIATSEIGGDERALTFLRLTLANGADVGALDSYNGTGLIRAADRGFVEIVRELLSTSIDVDHVNRLGWTALLEAIILGGGDRAHTEVVRLLVAAGASVNIADRAGVTPLQHARSRSFGGIVAILEPAGAR